MAKFQMIVKHTANNFGDMYDVLSGSRKSVFAKVYEEIHALLESAEATLAHEFEGHFEADDPLLAAITAEIARLRAITDVEELYLAWNDSEINTVWFDDGMSKTGFGIWSEMVQLVDYGTEYHVRGLFPCDIG